MGPAASGKCEFSRACKRKPPQERGLPVVLASQTGTYSVLRRQNRCEAWCPGGLAAMPAAILTALCFEAVRSWCGSRSAYGRGDSGASEASMTARMRSCTCES